MHAEFNLTGITAKIGGNFKKYRGNPEDERISLFPLFIPSLESQRFLEFCNGVAIEPFFVETTIELCSVAQIEPQPQSL